MDEDEEKKLCDICGENESVGLVWLKGVPWAYNVCEWDSCEEEANRKLDKALKNIRKQEEEEAKQ